MKTPTIRAVFLLAALAACSRDEGRAPEHASSASTTSVGLATAPTKPEMLPPDKRRVLELEGGVRVEVLAEGQGSIVAPGDEVALSMTLSYVPLPPKPEVEVPKVDAAAPKTEHADGAQPAKSKHDAEKKPADASTESAKSETPSDTKPVEIVGAAAETSTTTAPAVDAKADEAAKSEADGAKVEVGAPATAESASGSTTTMDEAAATASSTAPDPAPPATDAAPPPTEAVASTTEDATGTAAAPTPMAAPLEPVIVLSTKMAGTPIRGRVGAEGGLIPGLSRALVGLRAGTIAEITLPPEAAYGADGLPAAGIPAGTSLTARIEIREVRR